MQHGAIGTSPKDYWRTDIETPKERYKFYVAPAEGIQIEMQHFPQGTYLGEGNVIADFWPGHLLEFTPAEGISPDVVNAGRIQARLVDGLVRAEPIADKTLNLIDE
jgi:hypothetical protein